MAYSSCVRSQLRSKEEKQAVLLLLSLSAMQFAFSRHIAYTRHMHIILAVALVLSQSRATEVCAVMVSHVSAQQKGPIDPGVIYLAQQACEYGYLAAYYESRR